MTNIENESQCSEARSPVIDLEAEDVSPAADTGDTELPKEEPVPPPPPLEKRPLWTTKRIATVVAIIAALLGAWAYREFGARWWPPSAMSTMEERLGTLEASNHTLNEQLTALSGAFDNFKSGASQGADAQANKITTIEAKLAELDKALSELRQSVASLGSTTQGSADPAALAQITQRLERLEQHVSALQAAGSTAPATGNENSPELTQALADLKAKFEAGVAYKEELDRIAVYVPQNADAAALAPFASSGIANAQALGAALDALVPSLAGPAADGPAAKEASGFWAWVGSVVKVRDLYPLDWAELGKSAAADAKAGDLKAAIARLEKPGGDLPQGLADWRDKARQRLNAESAMAQLAAAVTQIIMGKP
jgi:chaperonin cofactor prefoldin